MNPYTLASIICFTVAGLLLCAMPYVRQKAQEEKIKELKEKGILK